MISRNELAAIHSAGGKELSEMTGIIRRHWCPFVVSVDKCNKMCSANPYCEENLLKVIDGTSDGADKWGPVMRASVWQSAMVYRIRNRRAAIKEEKEVPTLETNRLGEIRSGHGLEALSRELGVAL